jgi:alkanesulfonate monooxygenase SsuD/methylene tetrahydromethanopterin reductase-like flavin-dependent oxidoreductase (luciferase family)
MPVSRHEEKAAMVRHYDQTAAAAGRDPAAAEHISAVLAHVADDRELALADITRLGTALLPRPREANLSSHAAPGSG